MFNSSLQLRQTKGEIVLSCCRSFQALNETVSSTDSRPRVLSAELMRLWSSRNQLKAFDRKRPIAGGLHCPTSHWGKNREALLVCRTSRTVDISRSLHTFTSVNKVLNVSMIAARSLVSSRQESNETEVGVIWKMSLTLASSSKPSQNCPTQDNTTTLRAPWSKITMQATSGAAKARKP